MAADSLHGGLNPHQPVTQLGATASLTLLHGLVMWQAAAWIEIAQPGLARFVMVWLLPVTGVHALVAVPVFYFLGRLLKPTK